MELLIPGLILVALMAYASTRIKKSAARAYEAETVETDEFTIQKPDGFLNVIGGDPKFAFEAYSKEFGGDGAEDFRKGTATLRVREDVSADGIAGGLLNSDDEIITDLNEVIAETPYRVVEAKRREKGVDLRIIYKLAVRNDKVYELEIVTLPETTEEFMRNIEIMLDTFELKPATG